MMIPCRISASSGTAGALIIIRRHCLQIILLLFPLVIGCCCSIGPTQLSSNKSSTASQQVTIQAQQAPGHLDDPATGHYCNTSSEQCHQENNLLRWQLISGDNQIRRLNSTTATTTSRPELAKAKQLLPSPTLHPKASLDAITTATTIVSTRPPPQSGLITRTTDAIYRALTGYFSHDDDYSNDRDLEILGPAGSDARIKIKPIIPSSTPSNHGNTTSKASDTDGGATAAPRATTVSPAIRAETKPTQAARTSPQPSRGNSQPQGSATKSPAFTPTTLRPPSSTTKRPAWRASSLPSRAPTTQTIPITELPTSSTSTKSSRLAIDLPESTIQPHLNLNLYQDEPESSLASPTPAISTSTTTLKPIAPFKQKADKTKSTTTTTTTTTTPSARTTTLGPSGDDSVAVLVANRTATNTTISQRQVADTEASSDIDYKASDALAAGAARGNFQENSIEFFSFLNRAINSIYSIKELTYLNRTTRLAHESSELTPADSGVSSLLPSSGEAEGGGGGASESESGEHEETDDRETSLSRAGDSTSSDRSSAGAVQKQKLQQVTTRDEIMLLCKLLHKQLENGLIITTPNGTLVSAINGTSLLPSPSLHLSDKQQKSATPAGAATTTTTTTTTTTNTPVKQRDLLEEFVSSGMHIRDPLSDLNETHENRLLESTFALERRAANEASYEESGQSFLSELFNAAFRQKFYNYLTTSSRSAPRVGTENSSLSPTSPALIDQKSTPSQALSMRLWSKTITGGRGGSLKLVYWLVLQATSESGSASSAGKGLKYKVLDADEANDLIDLLDHSIIQQAIDNRPLIRPIVLVAPYKRSIRAQTGAGRPAAGGDDADSPLSNMPPSPHVTDDTLASPSGYQQAQPSVDNRTAPSNNNKSSPSGLQLFVDKLFKSSFNENLHLYLIVFIIVVFLIVLCFTIPAICSKLLYNRTGSGNMMPTPTTTTAGRLSGNGNGNNNNSSSNYSGTTHTKRTRTGSHTGGGPSRRTTNGARYPGSTAAAAAVNSGDYKAVGSISGALDYRRDDRSYLDDDEYDYGRMRATGGTINEAVWTKLSNSTTTLTKDRTRTMYDDGQVCVPILRHGQYSPDREQLEREKLKRYEWYTFEDKTTTISRRNNHSGGGGAGAAIRDKRSQTFTLDDQYKATKSMQTNSGGQDDGDDRAGPLASAQESAATLRAGDQRLMNMNMSFRDRIETRNSDTLTKSELVMLKEKLIPIGRQQAMGTVDSGPAGHDLQRPSHDYVNTASASNQQQQQQQQYHQPTRYIDMSADSSDGIQARVAGSSPPSPTSTPMTTAATGSGGGGGGGLASDLAKRAASSSGAGRSPAGLNQQSPDQRTPKMRYLELPSKAQVKVDEIKSELSRVEERDTVNQQQAIGSTYKRYDVI